MSSLGTAVSVLRCFSTTCSELTVTEVAQRLGLPKSNVSRLLRSMRDVGLLDSARDGRGYCPGVMLLGFGQVAGAGHSLGVRADAAVAAISQASGHAAFVSARVGRQMVGLTHHAGRHPLQVGVALGGNPLPIDACATGRAWLATLTDEAIGELIGGAVSRPNPQAPASLPELLARVARVRECGFAESHNEAGKGVGAIAVAVHEARTGEVLSFCVTFPEATVDQAERQQLTDALLKARSDIMRSRNER